MPVRKLFRLLPLWDVPFKWTSPRHRPLSSLTPMRSAFNGTGRFVGISESSGGKRKGLWPGHYIRSTPLCTPCFPADSNALSLSCAWIFATPWTVARQASLSMGFFRRGPWSELPFPPLAALHYPRMEPAFPVSLALQADSLPIGTLGRHFQAREETLTTHFLKHCKRVKQLNQLPQNLLLTWQNIN